MQAPDHGPCWCMHALGTVPERAGAGQPRYRSEPDPCTSAASGAPIGTTSPGGARSLVLPGQSTCPKWHGPGRQVECTPKLGKQEGPGDRMVNPDRLRFMTDRVGAKTVEVRSSNASAVSHPHQVARLVLAAARVGTRGWAGVAAELASGRGHGPQPGGIDPPDRRRGQPAQEWSGPEVAGRKAAQVEPGVAGAAHQP
jgi:hypothetical protein